MDKLLESKAVSDLAFGECERAKPARSLAYCRRLQQMLAFAVKQEDLDTLRACYMLEAYDSDPSRAKQVAREANITASKVGELNRIGSGVSQEQEHTAEPGIIMRPGALDGFGNGKGNITNSTNGIITEPVPARRQAAMETTVSPPQTQKEDRTKPPDAAPDSVVATPIPYDPSQRPQAVSAATGTPSSDEESYVKASEDAAISALVNAAPTTARLSPSWTGKTYVSHNVPPSAWSSGAADSSSPDTLTD